MRETPLTVSVAGSVCAVGGHGRHTGMSVGKSWGASILYGKRKISYGRLA